MKIVLYPGFVPSPQPSVSCAARATKLEWHVFPPATDRQHVPENLDHGTVRNAWPTAFLAYRLLSGKQALQLREERIWHPSTCPPSSLHGSRDQEGAVRTSLAERGALRAYSESGFRSVSQTF